MPTTENTQAPSEALSTAIDHLQATKTGPSTFSYFADEICSEVEVTRDQLIALGNMLIAGREDAYSHWCSEYSA